MAERTNPHTEIVVGARDDASPVFDKIKGNAQGMAQGVEQSAKKAGEAVGGIGANASPAAGKVDAATRSIIQSVERATAAMKSGAKGGADYFEVLAKQRGVSGDVLAPYIKALREAEAAQQSALLGQQGMAMSAKQTAAALRGVPAQITDIVVSLQGGQAPLTVLLQQGGQLRDMFGGAGAAARALGSAVLGFLTPFTVLAATAGAAALAYRQGSKEAEAYTKTLILSGNAAGTSADSLADMARAIDASNRGITQGKAAEVLNSIAASGDVAADKLQRYARAAIEFERAGGGASEEVAKAFSSLAGEPLAAVEKLNKSTHFLTAEIYHQIKALEDEGRSADAARLAQEAYAGMLDERIPKLNANLGLLEKGWQGITSAAAEAWDSMLNVGRSQTIGSRLESAQKLLADYENTMPGKRTTEQVARVQEAGGVDGLRSQIAGLQELMDTQRKADEQQRKNNLAAQAAIDLSNQATKYDSDLEKQRKAVAQATERYTQALTASNLSEADRARMEQDYLKTVSGITAAKETRASAARKENKDLEAQARVFAELAGLSSTYHKELAAAQEQRTKGNLSEEQYIAYVGELIQKQPFAIALTKEETEAAKARAKAVAEQLAIQDELNAAYVQDSKAREAGRQAVSDYARGMDEASEALKYELSLMGLSQRERDVALEQYRIELDLKKQIAAVNANTGFTQSDRDDEIARLQAAGAIAKANAANKVFLDDWRQSVGQYDDIFRRGFADMLNNGKDGWKSFTRSLVTTFKTSVADQIYKMFAQKWVMNIVASVSGVIGSGAASAANAAAGGSGIAGAINTASSLNTLYGTASQALYGGVAGASAASLGYANAVGLVGGDAIGALAAANGMWAGVATGAQAAAQSAIAANLALEAGTAAALPAGTISTAAGGAAAGGGISGALASIPGWGWAAMAALALLGSGVFDSRGANHAGGVYSTATSDRAAAAAGLGLSGDALGDFTARGNAAIDAQLGATVGALSGVYQSLAKYAGDSAKQIDIVAGFALNGRHKDEDAYGYFTLLDKLTGETLASYSKRDGGLGSDPDKAWAQYSADMGKALVDEIRKADIPAWMEGIFAGLDKDVNLDKLQAALQQVQAVDSAFGALGKSMQMFSSISGEMQSQLLAASGGLQGLTASAGAFYEGFYTEAERMAILGRNVQGELAKLDIHLDPAVGEAAKESFRRTVEAAMAAGQGELAAKLMAMSGAFAQAADYAAEATSELESRTQQLRVELLQAQGDLKGAAELQRSTDTAKMTQAQIAIYDYNAALEAQIQTAKDAQAAAEEYRRAQESAARSQLSAAQSAINAAQGAIESILGQATSAYVSAQDAVTAAQNRVTDVLRQQAQEAYNAAKAMHDLGQTLRDFVRGEVQDAQQTFQSVLTQALAGDQAAMRELPGAAREAASLAKLQAGSSTEARLAEARIMAGVLQAARIAESVALPAAPQEPDALAEANRALVKAQGDLAAALSVANAIGAPLAHQVADLVAQFAKAQADLAAGQAEEAAANAILNAIKDNTGATAQSAADQVVTLATLRSELVHALETGFAGIDLDSDGLLTIDEFKAGMAGKASDGWLQQIFRELDANGDGTISKLEAVRQATLNINAGGGGGVVRFDPGDPLYSIWQGIGWSTAWLTHIHGYLGHIHNTQLGDSWTLSQIRADTDWTKAWLKEIYGYLAVIDGRLLSVMSGAQRLWIRGSTSMFAKGGVFTNSVVSGATPFDMGVMGEAGPEAIMPLQRGPDGSLGVRTFGRISGADNGSAAVVSELRNLREDNRRQAAQIIRLNSQVAKLLSKWDDEGQPAPREAVPV